MMGLIKNVVNVATNGNGKINNRITIALDDMTHNLLLELKDESHKSQSEIIRKSIQFYHKFKETIGSSKNGIVKRINTYLDLLSHGEHIILDVDHFLSFLKFIEESPDQDQFWKMNKSIGIAHAEEFSDQFEFLTVERVIERLEACNFFKIVKDTSQRYTLLLGSEIQKNFIKTFLEEVLFKMGFNVEIREGLSKLKLIIK
ncbi:MAG: ribbon-helix-helix protein, CopG family [Promethearchaeota archaeon]